MRGSGDHQRMGCCAEYHGKHAALVGREQARRAQVPARREQPGRFAQRLIQGREPIRVRLFAKPHQPAQSRSSSSGAL